MKWFCVAHLLPVLENWRPSAINHDKRIWLHNSVGSRETNRDPQYFCWPRKIPDTKSAAQLHWCIPGCKGNRPGSETSLGWGWRPPKALTIGLYMSICKVSPKVLQFFTREDKLLPRVCWGEIGNVESRPSNAMVVHTHARVWFAWLCLGRCMHFKSAVVRTRVSFLWTCYEFETWHGWCMNLDSDQG